MSADMALDTLDDAALRLAAAGVENPAREAKLLRDLAAGDAERFADHLRRRCAREPFARISGRRGFWTLDLAISEATLDPRPDSETLIEAALEFLPDRAAPLRAVDFGSGSGALLLAFLSEFPHATGIGIDRAPGAVEVARRNAAAAGLDGRARFEAGDWRDASPGVAEVVLANPPYIPSGAIDALAPEVARFEPRLALDGGVDGLTAYRQLAPIVAGTLRPGGFAFLELGQGHARAVAAIMAAVGLEAAGIRPDLARIERCLAIRQGFLAAKPSN
jgi:release factor glutamine methyltransferase